MNDQTETVAPTDPARYEPDGGDDVAEGNKGRRGGPQPGSGRPTLSPDEATERLNLSVPASLKARVRAFAEARDLTDNAAGREILEAGLAAIDAASDNTSGDE